MSDRGTCARRFMPGLDHSGGSVFLAAIVFLMFAAVLSYAENAPATGTAHTALPHAGHADYLQDGTGKTGTVRIGVLANRGRDTCLREWGPTAVYLSEVLDPMRFEIVPLDFREILPAIEKKEISCIIANPSIYVYLEVNGLASRIATMQVPGETSAISSYGGVVFTRSDRTDINSFSDLRGKKFSAVDKSSTGGWHAAYREFRKQGILPEKYFRSVKFEGTHDRVVEAVISGRAEAGTVRSSHLERMATEGLLSLADIKILSGGSATFINYPYLLSTRLYPEWPFAAVAGADTGVSKRIITALLQMKQSDRAALAVRGSGWAIPHDYFEVHEMLKELSLPPYDRPEAVTLRKILSAYWPVLLAAVFALSVLTIAVFHFSGMNKKLRDATGLLEESEKKYRQLFDNANEAIYVVRNMEICFANRQTARLTGISESSLTGHMLYDFLPSGMHRETRFYYAKILREKSSGSMELRLEAPGKPHQWLLVNTVYITWEGAPSTLNFATDITKRKMAETALEKRIIALTRPVDDIETVEFEELFSIEEIQRLQDEFADATGVASIITKPDGTPITRQSNFCRLCNDIIRCTEKGKANCMKSDEALAKLHPEGPLVQKCLSGGLWDASANITVGRHHIANWFIGQVREEGQSEENIRHYAMEIGADEKEAVKAFYEVPSMPREKIMKITRVLFTLANQLSSTAYQNIQQARFITELRHAEEERKNIQAQLLQAQKMESVGRLAGGVAHDFNNMLGVIIGHAELALETVQQSSAMHRHLSEILGAANRSASLTGQLLAFARKQNITPKVLDLNMCVEKILDMLDRLTGENIVLQWVPGREISRVMADETQITQILTNLCANARDAISDTGKIVIETSDITFDEKYLSSHPGAAAGNYVMLAVSDNGCGMDSLTLSRVFEPFFTTRETGRGTGLGLAMVYGIVKQNRGFITAQSEPGSGSSFKIYLPAHTGVKEDAVQAQPGTAEHNGRTVNSGKTVLLVEDEPAILEMSRLMLLQSGFSVITASGPGEAVRQAENSGVKIDLLLTDVIMPEMNGRELGGKLLKLFPEMKILYMSGYTADIISPHGVAEQGVNFMQKPFSLKDLEQQVQKALDS